MKIAILVRILWSAGTQKIAIQEAITFSQMGHDVELIFLRKTKSGEVYEDMLKGVKYRIVSEVNRSPLVPLYDFITGIFMSNRKGEGRVDYNLIRRFPSLAKDNYDIIICHDQWAGLAGYYSWRKYKINYVVMLHEQINEMPWVTGLNRIIANIALLYQRNVLIHAKKVFSVTRKIATTAENFYVKSNIAVSDNFPGLEIKPFLNYCSKSNTILLNSFWNESKFPEMYLDLFKKIKDYSFAMIGNWISDSYKETFIGKLKALGVLQKVKFIDKLSEVKKIEIIANCKFCVRFGKGEFGPGIGSIEALENGVPLIINRELGIADYLREYKCGLILDDPRDTDKIIAFIQEHDNEKSYEMLQKSIKKFIEDHTWIKHCEKLMGLD